MSVNNALLLHLHKPNPYINKPTVFDVTLTSKRSEDDIKILTFE